MVELRERGSQCLWDPGRGQELHQGLPMGHEGKQAQPGKSYDVTGVEGHPAWSLSLG